MMLEFKSLLISDATIAQNQDSEKSIVDPVISSQPEVIEVYTEAIFESSPSPSLTQDEMESLGRFTTNLDHLARNIKNIVVDRTSSCRRGDGKCDHTAISRMFVRSENLWQSARSYLWKYLGQDSWERGNGTSISLKRIHQKN